MFCEETLKGEGVAECGTAGGVVEDAPNICHALLAGDGGCEKLQKGFGVLGVVHAREAMQPVVDEVAPASGSGGFVCWRWVGRYPGDLEPLEELIGFGGEPCGMAGFEDGRA